MDIFLKKEKITINLIKCFGMLCYVVLDYMFIWGRILSHKIEFKMINLMMTIRMQERMDITINCQVELMSENEINAR